MIELNVTCLFFIHFLRGKYNLKYVCCLVINFLVLIPRMKSARDSLILKSCAQFEGCWKTEIVIEVTVTWWGEASFFSCAV
jgi:hypothetical protein